MVVRGKECHSQGAITGRDGTASQEGIRGQESARHIERMRRSTQEAKRYQGCVRAQAVPEAKDMVERNSTRKARFGSGRMGLDALSRNATPNRRIGSPRGHATGYAASRTARHGGAKVMVSQKSQPAAAILARMLRSMLRLPVAAVETLLGIGARRRRRRAAILLVARALQLESARPAWLDVRLLPTETFTCTPAPPATRASDMARAAAITAEALAIELGARRGSSMAADCDAHACIDAERVAVRHMLRALRVAVTQLLAGATLRQRDLAPLWDMRRMILDGLEDEAAEEDETSSNGSSPSSP